MLKQIKNKYSTIITNTTNNEEVFGLYFCYTLKSFDDENIYCQYESFLEKTDSNIRYNIEEIKKDSFKNNLFDISEEGTNTPYDFVDIDNMSGREFKHYLFRLFTEMGYNCIVTLESKNQGLDLVVKKGSLKVVV